MQVETPKTIDTLVEDIYAILTKGKVVSEEDINAFGKELADKIAYRLKELTVVDKREPTVRPSNYGKPLRQLWYELNKNDREPLPPWVKMKFLYGDIVELLVLFLAKQAGHSVTHQQHEATHPSGVKGSMDCKIDGVLTDVKSTSGRSFKKFRTGTLEEDDPFGYIAQLRFYLRSENEDLGAFLAVSKEGGHICVMKQKADHTFVDKRLDTVLKIIKETKVPGRCYETILERSTGSNYLPVGCAYCGYKSKCYSSCNGGTGLRTFITGSGSPRFYSNVRKIHKDYKEVTHCQARDSDVSQDDTGAT